MRNFGNKLKGKIKYQRGAAYVLMSAVIYGFIPVMAKDGQTLGVNAATMTLLRMVLCLPVMLVILFARGVSLHLTSKELKGTVLLSFFGMAGAMLTLNFSYGFVDVGTATAVHFIYPVLIILWCVILGERKTLSEWAALVSVMAGIVLFIERGGGRHQIIGLSAALISGICYAFYVIYSDKAVSGMDFFKLSFYVCLFSGCAILIYGVLTQRLDFSFGRRGFITALLVSASATLCALPLFQAGVRAIGASRSGILSAAEPTISLMFGYMLLGEEITLVKAIGSIMILGGIILINRKK